jgi:hypothetical protein
MNTAAATITTATPGATKATPNPAYSGAGSPKGQESSRVLLLCLRGIAAFCWAASRRTLERMLLAYLQSTVNATLLRSLIANLTAIVRGGGGVPTCTSKAEELEARRALDDKEGAGAVTGGGESACVNSKKVSWTYMRGAALSCLYPPFLDIDLSNGWLSVAGVSLALSELCQDYRYGGGRIPLSAILDLSTCLSKFNYYC